MLMRLKAVTSVGAALMFAMTAAGAPPSVLQRGYDANVSGANLAETTLNTSNVTPSTFGLVFKLPVDDNVYAQPLYVPGVAIAGQGTHNVLYVATMNDTLYAFDADAGGAPLWKINVASLVGATPVPIANFAFSGNQNIVGNLGILSTPVIDQSTNTLYLVACTLENGTMVYRLHAVDIRSGDELIVAGGTVISGSYGGVTFNSTGVTQRVSLVLAGNQVVFGFGAMEAESSDIGGYVGWVMAYNKSTLQQNGAFATVITGYQGGGVWQSGRPPVVDGAGYVYVFVGNSYGSGGYDGVSDFSESALKLDPSNGLKRIDSFTPGDWLYRDGNDFDLGSSGPLLIPGTSLIVGGGKTGILYLLDTGKMGGESAGDAGAVQVQTVSPWEIRGGPVYWQRSAANNGPLLYICGSWDVLKAYPFNGATFATSPSAEGSVQETWPGGILALSAYNDTPGTGVLWETVVTSGDAENNPPAPGELLAYDANDVATELWDSTMNASRDGFGNFAKFVPPLVVNGRVYVATQSNQVAVYGLLSTYTTSPSTLAFGSETTGVASTSIPVTVTNTGTVALPITSITVSGANSPLFHETDNCVPSVPAPGTCTINVVFKPTSAGSKTATLNVIAGNGAGTQTVALSGTGVVPTYTALPATLPFGSETLHVASTPMSVTVTNTGAVALPITSTTIDGTNPEQFTQINYCGTSVPAPGTCTISVVFKPTSTGSKTATLNVNAGGGGGRQTVALSGSGVLPTYTALPLTLPFGDEALNVGSTPMSVTVTNTGAVALPITSITIGGTNPRQFSQTNNCGTSVAVPGTCTISVVFTPTAAGSKTATLSIKTGNGAGTQTVTLSGTAM
ncbi:MAG: choice-of-anchor D domain-containing protein [Steroidobacteraceae bacterium]